MPTSLIVDALLGLLPVLAFLTGLVLLDSYKLVAPWRIMALIAVGAAMTFCAYFVNGWLMQALGLGLQPFTRYVSPLVEEGLKGAAVVWLIRRHRIGFLVDAAIAGFALGCGFAVAENLYTLWRVPDAGTSTWIVRGFGTAIMHGGATAAFALISLAILERDERHGLKALLPGFAAAVLLHSAFNHLNRASVAATVTVLVAVPVLLMLAYQRSERTLGEWLGHGFDADAERLALLRSGGFGDSPTGRYLASLRAHFDGLVVADLLCYLRLFTELSLRAKGLLLMRENGFSGGLDDATRERLAELGHLERTIGPTGLLALHPLLPMRRKTLHQLYGA